MTHAEPAGQGRIEKVFSFVFAWVVTLASWAVFAVNSLVIRGIRDSATVLNAGPALATLITAIVLTGFSAVFLLGRISLQGMADDFRPPGYKSLGWRLLDRLRQVVSVAWQPVAVRFGRNSEAFHLVRRRWVATDGSDVRLMFRVRNGALWLSGGVCLLTGHLMVLDLFSSAVVTGTDAKTAGLIITTMALSAVSTFGCKTCWKMAEAFKPAAAAAWFRSAAAAPAA